MAGGLTARFLSALTRAVASIRSVTSGTSASTAQRRMRYPSGRPSVVVGLRYVDHEINQTIINDVHAAPPFARQLG